MMVLGIPIAATTAFQAHKAATDRGFLYAAFTVLGLQAALAAGAVFLWLF
jgi:hypothetical protein